MQLELRHLRTLCAIADAGSLCRAAAAVGVSQPALTGQLHRIEASLGGEVFRRGRQGTTPTPFGLFVISRARSVLFAVDELLTGTGSRTPMSSVRIGGYSTPVLTGLVRRLFDLPGTRITVQTEYSPRLLLDLLASHRLDAATLVDYPGHELHVASGVDMCLVASEPLSVALPAGHRLAALAEVPLAALADEDWLVTPPDGAGWPEYFFTACQEAGFAPRVRHTMTEHDMIRSLVAEGRAVAPCQAILSVGPDIAVRPLTAPTMWMRHLLAWRRRGPLAERAPELARLAFQTHQAAVAKVPGLAARLAMAPDAAATAVRDGGADGPAWQPPWHCAGRMLSAAAATARDGQAASRAPSPRPGAPSPRPGAPAREAANGD